jgi:hypothetical protein
VTPQDDLANVLDAGSTTTGVPYFVMEYVPGNNSGRMRGKSEIMLATDSEADVVPNPASGKCRASSLSVGRRDDYDC